MRISEMSILERLNRNWGLRAECLNCMAEMRIEDPAGDLTFYVLAVNPENFDDCYCIVDSKLSLETGVFSLGEINSLYDKEGRFAVKDTDWKPIHAALLFKKLREKHGET